MSIAQDLPSEDEYMEISPANERLETGLNLGEGVKLYVRDLSASHYGRKLFGENDIYQCIGFKRTQSGTRVSTQLLEKRERRGGALTPYENPLNTESVPVSRDTVEGAAEDIVECALERAFGEEYEFETHSVGRIEFTVEEWLEPQTYAKGVGRLIVDHLKQIDDFVPESSAFRETETESVSSAK